MPAWVRWIVFTLIGLAVLALVGAGVLAYLVSRIDVRAEIERAVESATGRDFTIAGNVGVSYWPVLGVHAADASLANTPGGRAPAFLTAADIHVGVELRPLLDRRIVVRQFVLHQPQVALEIDTAGQPNWVLGARPATPPTPPAPAPQPPPEPTFDLGQTTLRSVSVDGGAISYFDARIGSGWTVTDVNLRTALDALDQPMRVRGSASYVERPIDIDLTVARPGAALRGEITPITLVFESELLNANFSGQTTASAGALAGTVQARGPNLRELTRWAGAALQVTSGFEQFAVNGRLDIGNGAYSFTNAGFAVDRLRGRGDFVLTQRGGKPYVSGRLELFDFDLNPYLTGEAPPASTEAEVAAAADAPAQTQTADLAVVEAAPRALDVQAAPSEAAMDFSGMRAFNADLELVTAAILFQRMRVDGARLNLVLNDGFMAATVHNLSLYGGSGSGRFEIDAREPAIYIMQELRFNNLQARPFLTDAINFGNIEGRAELNLNLRTRGRTQTEMLAALDGTTYLEVVSGTLHGVDLGGVARTIRNALRGELIAANARTPFQGFSANFAIADGVLASDSLSFNTPDLRIPGIGVIDIPGRRLDMRLAPRSPQGGIVVPFSVRGGWEQISYASDMNDRAQREILPRVRAVQTSSRAAMRQAG
ncbi:MAG: AsmA family protein [Hyphomonadaceae bacterium]|nr:AsmA family protein [Hyphomonadaceae bacterium]